MSDRAAVMRRVRELCAQVFDVPECEVGPDFSAATSGAWTSLSHLMLISQLEGEYGVVFSNADIQRLISYVAIVDALAGRDAG